MNTIKLGAAIKEFTGGPQVPGLIPQAAAGGPPAEKWGHRATAKKWKGPKWARFRLFIKYADGSAKYHSWDYTYKYVGSVKVKQKSESMGLTKLLELARSKFNRQYEYMNIFCNVSENLSTATGNYDYLVCTITENAAKWKWPLFWQPVNELMTDPKRMEEYKTMKIAEYEKKAAIKQQIFNSILSNDKITAKQA